MPVLLQEPLISQHHQKNPIAPQAVSCSSNSLAFPPNEPPLRVLTQNLMEAEETAPQCRSQMDFFFHSFTFNHLFSPAAALLVFCILFHLSDYVLQLCFQCQSPLIHVQTPCLCLYITGSVVNRYSVSVWSKSCFSINVSLSKNVQRVGLGLTLIH